MADDWEAVARAISSRLEELGMTQLDAAAKSRVSPATIRELQYNKMPRRRSPRTLESLSYALEWPSDYLGRVLAGEAGAPHADETCDPVLQKLDHVLDELHDLRARIENLEQQQPGEDD